MNPPLRYTALALGLVAAWAIGYFAGGGSHSSRSGAATPFPETRTSDAAALSSSAIGRLIDGKNEFQRVRTLYEYSLSLGADGMAGAVNEAMQLPLTHRNMALGILFARWAELDPAGAVKYSQLLPRSANAGFLRRTALTTWAEQDLDAALAWARTLEKSDTRNDSLATIAGALAKRDPAAALKLIAENFTGRDSANAYDTVFSAWAENDFTSAYAAAQELTDPGLRVRAMRAALNQKLEADPHMVLEALRTAKLSELRWDLGNRAMTRWLERDFAAARDYALALPPGDQRDQGLQQVAKEFARNDPHAALDWLRTLPDDGSRDQAIQSLFGTWAGSDSKAALEGARALPEGRLRENALAQIAQNLVDTDISTALGILKELPPGNATDNAFQQVAWRWGRTDPKAAATWFIDNLPENNQWALQQIVSEWARNDPDAALGWASALPDDRSQKGSLLGQALSNLARSDPLAAVDRFKVLTAEQQAGAAGNLAGSWANRDPVAAAKWVMELKSDEARNNAVGSIASIWGQRDPAAATRWLETIPAGNTRDNAIQNFAFSVVQNDPEGATAWALAIGDAGKRDNALMGVVSNWARKNREAATQWVATTDTLTPEFRTRLEPALKQPKGPPRGFPGGPFIINR
ncbi:MAG: hypothetical protein ABMA13_00170 [Chthoniobacteraceae bacterium]